MVFQAVQKEENILLTAAIHSELTNLYLIPTGKQLCSNHSLPFYTSLPIHFIVLQESWYQSPIAPLLTYLLNYNVEQPLLLHIQLLQHIFLYVYVCVLLID